MCITNPCLSSKSLNLSKHCLLISRLGVLSLSCYVYVYAHTCTHTIITTRAFNCCMNDCEWLLCCMNDHYNVVICINRPPYQEQLLSFVPKHNETTSPFKLCILWNLAMKLGHLRSKDIYLDMKITTSLLTSRDIHPLKQGHSSNQDSLNFTVSRIECYTKCQSSYRVKRVYIIPG